MCIIFISILHPNNTFGAFLSVNGIVSGQNAFHTMECEFGTQGLLYIVAKKEEKVYSLT